MKEREARNRVSPLVERRSSGEMVCNIYTADAHKQYISAQQRARTAAGDDKLDLLRRGCMQLCCCSLLACNESIEWKEGRLQGS